jgi:hypothetical protein
MLSKEWLATVAPVGTVMGSDRWAAFGAGVFIHKPPLVWLVTAGHVIDKVGEQRVSVLITRSGGGLGVVEVAAILTSHDLSWVRDPANDLAAAPMPVPDQFDIKAVPLGYCLPMAELVPSMHCFTIGCPYGLRGVDAQRATPLVLDGVISGIDTTSGRIYASARTFPGNSGGPLIAFRSPSTPDGSLMVGMPTILLAGVMLETALLASPDPNDPIPPLHMGVAAPVDAVLRLLDSEPARAIQSRLAPHPN